MVTCGMLLSLNALASTKAALINCKVSSDLKKVILLRHANGDSHFFQENQVVNNEAHLAVPLKEEGYFFIAINRMIQVPIYLHPGDEVNLEILNDRVNVLANEDEINNYLVAFYGERMQLLWQFMGKEVVYDDLLIKIKKFEQDQLQQLEKLKHYPKFYQAQINYIKAIVTEYKMRPVMMPGPVMNTREANRALWSQRFNEIDLNVHALADLPNGMMLAGLYQNFAEFVLGSDKSFDATLNHLQDPAQQSLVVMNYLKIFRVYDTRAQEFIDTYKSYISEEAMNRLDSWKAKFETILPGKEVPDFELLTTQKEKIMLSTFQGNWVYIDLWATWCGPCKQEVPHFKGLAEQFKGDQIAFVAISLDNDPKRWNNYLQKKESGEVQQLFGGAGFDSPIAKFFKVSGVPRFILLDPQGRIVENNMSRPSDPTTKAMLRKHLES